MLGTFLLCFSILDSLFIIIITIIVIVMTTFINPCDRPFQLHAAVCIILSIVISELFSF